MGRNLATQEKELVYFSGLHAAVLKHSSCSVRPEHFVAAAYLSAEDASQAQAELRAVRLLFCLRERELHLINSILIRRKDITRLATQIITDYYSFPSPFARNKSESSQHEK